MNSSGKNRSGSIIFQPPFLRKDLFSGIYGMDAEGRNNKRRPGKPKRAASAQTDIAPLSPWDLNRIPALSK